MRGKKRGQVDGFETLSVSHHQAHGDIVDEDAIGSCAVDELPLCGIISSEHEHFESQKLERHSLAKGLADRMGVGDHMTSAHRLRMGACCCSGIWSHLEKLPP